MSSVNIDFPQTLILCRLRKDVSITRVRELIITHAIVSMNYPDIIGLNHLASSKCLSLFPHGMQLSKDVFHKYQWILLRCPWKPRVMDGWWFWENVVTHTYALMPGRNQIIFHTTHITSTNLEYKSVKQFEFGQIGSANLSPTCDIFAY